MDEKDSLRSALYRAPQTAGSTVGDPLEAREIMGMPLAARLAILSACESGRGEKSGGEGLLGLAWAFRAAGCPSIVASKWRVDDSATRDLMVRFYKAMSSGRTKPAALGQAMRSQLVHSGLNTTGIRP